ncbi:unnamed protein product [Chrysoparadoxa australica]
MAEDEVVIGEGCLVSEEADIQGNVRIGPGCIVHPCCTIVSQGGGAIIFGEDCVVEERAVITNESSEDMLIGAGNLFEVGCCVRSAKIGDFNRFQPKCSIGPEVVVCDGCTVGAGLVLTGNITAQSGTVLYYDSNEVDAFRVNIPPHNRNWNEANLEAYRQAIANPKKKTYLGKHHRLKI